MKKKNNFCLLVCLYGSFISACFTTVVNDGKEKIVIHNKNDNSLIVIPRKGHRRFGKSSEHAFFSVFIKQPNTQAFSEVYICQQNQCGKKGNIVLRLSDIENRNEVTQPFTITENEYYVPMVQKLPMMQKRGCRSCH
jgi:hypothetical protein